MWKGRCSASRKRLEHFVDTHFADSQWHTNESMVVNYSPSYNIGPGHTLPVVFRKQDDVAKGSLELSAFKFGLIPNFTSKATVKPDHYRMFNCRSEEMQNKPSFKNLVSRNRCIVLTEGFYEWKSEHFGDKQPYFVFFGTQNEENVDIMPMAGLFDCWIDENGVKMFTCTILTTSCSKELCWLHNRMPLILDESSMVSWVNTESPGIPKDMLQPYHGRKILQYHKVTPKMGKLSFQGKACCEEYGKSQKSILSMFNVKKEEQSKEETHVRNIDVKKSTGKRIVKEEDPGDDSVKKPKIGK